MRSKTNLPKATVNHTRPPIQKQESEMDKFIREMRENRQKMDEFFKNSNNQADIDRKKMDEYMKNTDKRIENSIKAMHRELGGISKSNGEVAESYFINSFDKSMQFAGQKYDEISSNLRKKISEINLQGEYDLVLYNCTSVVIIEIKYKARKEDVEELLNKAPTFKQLFPEYANYDIYLGLAGFHVNITAEKEAIKKGVAIIKQVGNNMVINDGHLKVF